jgi:hypothetical protein
MAKALMADVGCEIRRLVAAERNRAASDGELLDRFVSRGDQEAFATLLRRHGPMVLAVSRGWSFAKAS